MRRKAVHVPTGVMMLYQQAMDAATTLARLSWPIVGSQIEELEDFHSELGYEALAIRNYVADSVKDRFRPSWFKDVEDTSWSRLAEDFGYMLRNVKPLTTYLDRFYRAIVDAERYHGVTLDPDNLEADANVLNEYHRYSQVVVPVLRYCFTVADIYAAFQEFGTALDAMAKYSQHVRKKGLDHSKDPYPPDTKTHEIVWHATTAYHDILNHGFKTQEKLQFSAPGLGGAGNGVSFTSDYRFAQAILLFLQYVVKAINGPRSVEALCGLAEELGLPCDAILDQHAGNYRDLRKTPDEVTPGQAAEFVNQMFWYGGFKRKLINPVAGVDGDTLAERFAGKQLRDLGIIEAMVDTTGPAVLFVHAEDEWRVPVNAIVSFGPVGSQARKKTADVHDTTDPWRNERRDVRDALEHAADFYFGYDSDGNPIYGDLDLDDFVITHTYMTLNEIAQYDDVRGWLEAELGELINADDATIRKWSYKLRGEHYDDILQYGIPAIVLMQTPGFTGIADGQGRYNLAVALGIDTLPVILLTLRK